MDQLLTLFANGKDEGMAKAISQIVVYSLDKRKALTQLHGPAPGRHRCTIKMWANGVSASALLSGIVFLSYFSIYNTLGSSTCTYAAPVASFLTSFIKVPVGNSMRTLQCGGARNFIHATRKIYRHGKLSGLYRGYSTALVEDIIEMDIRNRLYTRFCVRPRANASASADNEDQVATHVFNIGVGMGSCAVAAGITTPFDVLRTHMAHPSVRCGPFQTARVLIRDHGPFVIYRGVALRTASNAIKSMVFFIVYEMLKHTK